MFPLHILSFPLACFGCCLREGADSPCVDYYRYLIAMSVPGARFSGLLQDKVAPCLQSGSYYQNGSWQSGPPGARSGEDPRTTRSDLVLDRVTFAGYLSVAGLICTGKMASFMVFTDHNPLLCWKSSSWGPSSVYMWQFYLLCSSAIICKFRNWRIWSIQSVFNLNYINFPYTISPLCSRL